jgi:hypothetical protein
MICPRDGTTLSATKYEADVEIDTCPSCQGAWLDAGELESIQRSVEKQHWHRTPEGLDSAKDSYIAVEQQIAPRVACPRCSKLMATRPYGMGSQIIIDECPEGCGMWLDGGELQALERFYEASQSEFTIPAHWRIWAGIVGFLGRSKAKS